jgi:transposase
MMRLRAGTRINTWIRTVREDVLPELRSFAAGIEQDYDAVLAALTLPYSSGVVEGHVNHLIIWNQALSSRARSEALRWCSRVVRFTRARA